MTQNFNNNLSIVQNLKIGRVFVFFLMASCSASALASDWRTVLEEELIQRWQTLTNGQDSAAVSFVGIRSDYQLPDCQHRPDIRIQKALQPGRNGIELGCSKPYWQQHFAVQLHVYQNVITLRTALRSNELVQPHHIHQTRQDIGQLNKGFYTRTDEVVGLQIKRSLRPGTVLNPDMLELPQLVKRGQHVAIRLKRPGIQVEMEGTALASGHKGQRIRVRNNQSQKVISATVIARDLVQVQ
ncbi:flagellar basal body P-ring formation chaperone FlgA [Bacterioplanoides sp. SCSIO 12839]|uniref:flagellar basal body P-ring formation chaperone FlgA n=1 Tax=Bacterioplanoides sp. SCSIO 12839 TaxID=2829569 RepID=UPI0021059097|nr:flagellar basal body P-ring formation chaperone FlgA [Bacterioplanoides sp. SCSIO 12839]UTW47313.1 flagellar basal body P-ring formation protein FlgA [Bacterioplanoides sp. SCSIO 12839]